MNKSSLINLFIFFALSLHNNLSAQHQTFLDVELGGNSELFKYELKQKGFYESSKEGYDCLYGQFLGADCRLWIHENNFNVEKIVINYRYEEDFSYEKAKSLVEGITLIIVKELKKRNVKHFIFEDLEFLGSSNRGNLIELENGQCEISLSGSILNESKDWMVFIVFRDSPNDYSFQFHKQQEESQ